MISKHQYIEMLTRTQPVRHSKDDRAHPTERESDLHDQIVSTCKARGWIIFHARMDCRTTYPLGTPDFIIATDDGRTIYVEAKARNGKLSPAQNAMLAWLRKNQQQCYVVSSIEEFRQIDRP